MVMKSVKRVCVALIIIALLLTGVAGIETTQGSDANSEMSSVDPLYQFAQVF
jgi:hypothetical protein